MNRNVPFNVVSRLPALIIAAGDSATYRFLKFFTAQIGNLNTRHAYARAVGDLFPWLEASTANVSSLHFATYVEDLGWRQSAQLPRNRNRAWPPFA